MCGTTDRSGKTSYVLGAREETRTEQGRFPANIILECICDEVVIYRCLKCDKILNIDEFEKIDSGYTGRVCNKCGVGEVTKIIEKTQIHTNPNCPCYMLDEQSGESKSVASGYNFKKGNQNNPARNVTNIKSGIHFNDKGGASRFFKQCKFDNDCSLCYTSLHKVTNKENICKNTNVNNAEKNLKTTQVIKENTVHLSAEELQDDKLAQLVRSVGNLCQKCTTDFVQSLVAISENQRGSQSQEVSQVIQGFIGNSKKCTLTQSLANYVELMDSIDTTQTTTNLLKLFGSVLPAINEYTQKIKKLEPKRFLYQAKASKSERNAGCEGLEEKQTVGGGGGIGDYKDDVNSCSGKYGSEKAPNKNNHPTVKPLKLMEYLCTLTKTPTKGTVLDPFMGSGTTGLACQNTGRDFIGIEREEEYIKIAEARLKNNKVQDKLF